MHYIILLFNIAIAIDGGGKNLGPAGAMNFKAHINIMICIPLFGKQESQESIFPKIPNHVGRVAEPRFYGLSSLSNY